jgi:hypothetical protein
MAAEMEASGVDPGGRRKLFGELLAARCDVSCLTPSQLLVKDMKIASGVPVPGLPILVKVCFNNTTNNTNNTNTTTTTTNNNNNNNNNLLTAIGLSPGGSGYFTCKQNMKLVTDKFRFKSRGLHEKHVVATWNVGSHLSICL